MRALLLDGYTDEPACLGVPPFISPYARLAFGALVSAGAQTTYITIDQYRTGEVDPSKFDLVAIVRNVAVPGKYLRGMPASDKELVGLSVRAKGLVVASLGVDPKRASPQLVEGIDHIASEDLDATLFDIVTKKEVVDRRRTYSEWQQWLERGAEACVSHPDFGAQLIAEVQMYRGCVRYITGGCRFCIEPLFGDVQFRKPEDILAEVVELSRFGVRNFRLGAQSCVYCYMSKETGSSEVPLPNVEAISTVLRSIREAVRPEVFHLDNANPAVIAAHPQESREITKVIAENCTSGNVLAFGLESADPKVAKANNLNTTSEQCLEAIRIVNEIGARRGASGLPLVLPGINFLCGLDGESRETYKLNMEFLAEVLDEGLLVRRINIRQVIASRQDFPGVDSKKDFMGFKRRVREEIDGPMLKRVVPEGTVLRSVHAELKQGGRTFGRQVGTYPLLVDVPYPVEIGMKIDVAVTRTGMRSVTGVKYPTNANDATLSMLEAIPGIGKKRAMAIVRNRPFRDPSDLWRLFDEPRALALAQYHLVCENIGRAH